MDLELKTLLGALVEGQVRLAEGQAKTDAAVTKLTVEVTRMSAEVIRMSTRLDAFSEAVLRGVTNGLVRDGSLEARIEDLTARVAALEQRPQH